MAELNGKVALISGGSKGIGFELAACLAQAQAQVIIANRDRKRGEESAAALRKEGFQVEFVQVDISDQSSLQGMFDFVMKKYGALDIMVNNAAVIKHLPAGEFKEEDWRTMVDVNLKGTYFCCQAAWRCMKEQKRGKIINISSVMGTAVVNGRSIYAVTKAGINHMTRSLAFEWAKDGITVNALAPGLTITELNERFYIEHPEDLERIKKKIPLGRVALASDYNGALLFLCSPAADYMTGHVLVLDGGVGL